jgi:hypothetical protein
MKPMLVTYELPGLQSVAIATVTPASSIRRAEGYRERVEKSAPGSNVATVGDPASNAISESLTNVQ